MTTTLRSSASATGRRHTPHHARALARALRPVARPDVFDPAMLLAHPEPARRWLTHAVEPGLPLVHAAELRMHGEVKLGGRWRPYTAIEALVPGAGFVWAARTCIGHLRVSGYDSYVNGAGSMRWRLVGLPLISAAGPDVTRSAAGRLAGESVLLPTSLVDATWQAGPDPDTATYFDGLSASAVTILVAADGALDGVSMHRWGDPDGTGYGERTFEVLFGGEYAADGMIVPDDMRARWVDAPGDDRGEFFRAAVDSVEFCTPIKP